VLRVADDVALTLLVDAYLCVSVGDLHLTAAQISVRYEFGVYVGCEILQLKRTLCAVGRSAALLKEFVSNRL
jgi:hypothetical protein